MSEEIRDHDTAQPQEDVPAWAKSLIERSDTLAADLQAFKTRTNKEAKARRLQLERLAAGSDPDQSEPKNTPSAKVDPWVSRMIRSQLSDAGVEPDELDNMTETVIALGPEKGDAFVSLLRRAQDALSKRVAAPSEPQAKIKAEGRAGAGAQTKSYRVPKDFRELTKTFSPDERKAFFDNATEDEIEAVHRR